MPKLYVRIIAFFLLPCLVGAGLVPARITMRINNGGRAQGSPLHISYASQALAERVITIRSTVKAEEFREAGAVGRASLAIPPMKKRRKPSEFIFSLPSGITRLEPDWMGRFDNLDTPFQLWELTQEPRPRQFLLLMRDRSMPRQLMLRNEHERLLEMAHGLAKLSNLGDQDLKDFYDHRLAAEEDLYTPQTEEENPLFAPTETGNKPLDSLIDSVIWRANLRLRYERHEALPIEQMLLVLFRPARRMVSLILTGTPESGFLNGHGLAVLVAKIWNPEENKIDADVETAFLAYINTRSRNAWPHGDWFSELSERHRMAILISSANQGIKELEELIRRIPPDLINDWTKDRGKQLATEELFPRPTDTIDPGSRNDLPIGTQIAASPTALTGSPRRVARRLDLNKTRNPRPSKLEKPDTAPHRALNPEISIVVPFSWKMEPLKVKVTGQRTLENIFSAMVAQYPDITPSLSRYALETFDHKMYDSFNSVVPPEATELRLVPDSDGILLGSELLRTSLSERRPNPRKEKLPMIRRMAASA